MPAGDLKVLDDWDVMGLRGTGSKSVVPVADQADAFIVPVRLEGLDATPFTRLHRSQIRRRWFPKVTVTVLEPVKLVVDPNLKGKYRRQAAGAALYEIMSNLIYRTTSIERTVPQALIEAAELHGMNRVAVEDPIAGTLTYRKLLIATGAKPRRL